jgi:hypothetical protein
MCARGIVSAPELLSDAARLTGIVSLSISDHASEVLGARITLRPRIRGAGPQMFGVSEATPVTIIA